MRRFRRSRPLRWSLIFLAVLHLVAVFAGFFAPYDPAWQHRSMPLAPPTRIRFVDQQGGLHLRPFVYQQRPSTGDPERYEEDFSRLYPVRFFVSGAPYRIAGLWSSRLHLWGVDEPATLFLIGTDPYGRDQWSRLLHGAQISLLTGPLAAVLALSCGLLLGSLAGYFGSWIDELVMAGGELFLSLPWLYLLLAARAFLPLDLAPRDAFLALIVLLGLIGWVRPARLVRGVVLSAREREYVLAARGFGASEIYVLRRHVLPQARGVVLTQASLLIPRYILAEVTLSFFGLGVNEPAASWGSILAGLERHATLGFQWWMWLPALLLFPVFLAYYMLATCLGAPMPDK